MVAASADVADVADDRLLAWQRVQPQPQGVAVDVDAGDVALLAAVATQRSGRRRRGRRGAALPKSDCDGLLETRKH
jgi:hypothetical protein